MIYEKKHKNIEGLLDSLGKALGGKSKDDLRVMRQLQNDLDFRLATKTAPPDIADAPGSGVRHSWANPQIRHKDARNIET